MSNLEKTLDREDFIRKVADELDAGLPYTSISTLWNMAL